MAMAIIEAMDDAWLETSLELDLIAEISGTHSETAKLDFANGCTLMNFSIDLTAFIREDTGTVI
ncbi:hypothetical protein LSA01_05260 [Latilactobacillus sakei]|uniref:Uncharacterized protein n=1 Tax=Latilactobacillus curvatus TaxID=28038 RepID=A0ABN6GKY0_LATCU|nr:hypothetical protein NFHkm12_05320 [Latilactobacillus curvatus]BCX31107.1 hypothetical protein LTWDN19_16740 [Latilactobacillus curvatus]GEA76447.1 hypothetical protein LSA01_05260 [Latilactobacillus sakei]